MLRWHPTWLLPKRRVARGWGYFVECIPWTDEVSIGHALICDALYYGLENTVQLYKRELKY